MYCKVHVYFFPIINDAFNYKKNPEFCNSIDTKKKKMKEKKENEKLSPNFHCFIKIFPGNNLTLSNKQTTDINIDRLLLTLFAVLKHIFTSDTECCENIFGISNLRELLMDKIKLPWYTGSYSLF